MNRRVVITGCGIVSPLGNSPKELWTHLRNGESGVTELQRLPTDNLPTAIGGEATEFDESIQCFGELEAPVKKQIRKGLKVMCREIKMGVAAAQLALHDASVELNGFDRDRFGCVYGSDFITTEPFEFTEAVRACAEDQQFHIDQWADKGLAQVTPLWLLKYLPNMPACHVAIYNDLRGPNNSITVREASSNLAIAEAAAIIRRGSADAAIAGATGSRIHPLRTIHIAMQEQLAATSDDPRSASRPFDLNRSGMVLGEGSAAIVVEELESAISRNATILGEVRGYGSSSVMSPTGQPDRCKAMSNALQQALNSAQWNAHDIGHVHGHGLSTVNCDREEAQAIRNVTGDRPVVAAKSNFGNLGAASGMIETIASLYALQEGKLFRAINYENPDPECPIHMVTSNEIPAGDAFLNLNVTPQGQASSVLISSYSDS